VSRTGFGAVESGELCSDLCTSIGKTEIELHPENMKREEGKSWKPLIQTLKE
jgi:hypothetical protein